MLILISPLISGGAGAAEDVETSLIRALHEIRYIKEGDPEVTTSTCIGNPITPLCAADTFQAYGVYSDDRLVAIANGLIPGIKELESKRPYNPNTFCYQLMGYWYFHKDDQTLKKVKKIKAGDVALQIRYGVMVDGKCDLFYRKFMFKGMLMRKGPYGWYVLNFHPQIDYVRSPEFYGGGE